MRARSIRALGRFTLQIRQTACLFIFTKHFAPKLSWTKNRDGDIRRGGIPVSGINPSSVKITPYESPRTETESASAASITQFHKVKG
jgi:hypothetical protein